MSEPACRSEVARLMRQISEANEAAYQALYGLAQGTAQHAIERLVSSFVRFADLSHQAGDFTSTCGFAHKNNPPIFACDVLLPQKRCLERGCMVHSGKQEPL